MGDEDAPAGREPDDLLYDWFKHLTSLSLVTLGGVLSLSQIDGIELKLRALLLVVVLIAGGGFCSFTGADRLVHARTRGLPIPKSLKLFQRAAAGLLGAGLGAFLGIFLASLS